MSKAGKIAKISIKAVVLFISLFIYTFFIFRLCSTGEAPKSVSGIVWNETTRAAYEADPSGFQIFTQEPATFITNDGRFWVSDVVYLPQAKQLQLTIKYNDSTLKYLRQALADDMEISVDEVILPDEPFDYSLLSNGGVRYQDYTSTAEKNQNYNYRRIVFENVVIEENTTHYVDMYYIGAIDYTAIPYGSLLVWNTAQEIEEIDIEDVLPKDMK